MRVCVRVFVQSEYTQGRMANKRAATPRSSSGKHCPVSCGHSRRAEEKSPLLRPTKLMYIAHYRRNGEKEKKTSPIAYAYNLSDARLRHRLASRASKNLPVFPCPLSHHISEPGKQKSVICTLRYVELRQFRPFLYLCSKCVQSPVCLCT